MQTPLTEHEIKINIRFCNALSLFKISIRKEFYIFKYL